MRGANKKTTAPPPAGVSYAAYAARVSTDPPPHFACWHCATPLEERSPSCAWCGARRKSTGWRNTA